MELALDAVRVEEKECLCRSGDVEFPDGLGDDPGEFGRHHGAGFLA